jgi:hypothetical protein
MQDRDGYVRMLDSQGHATMKLKMSNLGQNSVGTHGLIDTEEEKAGPSRRQA